MATATRTRTARTGKPRPTTKAVKGVITAGQAWEALGADDQFKPSDLKAPASNRMLWALNNQGKLAIR